MSTQTLHVPLAERMRPKHLDEVLGQEGLLGASTTKLHDIQSTLPHKVNNVELHSRVGSLRSCLDRGFVPSIILWGPPGSGKTTIARLIAQYIDNSQFINISAVSSGVGDIKRICTNAQEQRMLGIVSCLFIDEIHRFNKAQQDVLLHYIEEGIITLIGATTENPSFEINSALLSRVQVFTLEALSLDTLHSIFRKAEQTLEHVFDIEEDTLQSLLAQSDGDARRLLNLAEQLYMYQLQNKQAIDQEVLKQVLMHVPMRYDKQGDQHYNLISALHKSIRGSDCDAALYWLARMLVGGEDPRYIARRLLRTAYEDIGLADIDAPQYVLQAWQSYERLGSPEGEIAIASAVIYLALAPKSNSSYEAIKLAAKSAKTHNSKSPPYHILNAPTTLMKNMGYGEGYIYDHNTKEGFSGQNYFPETMEREVFYKPVERGFEREMQKRLQYFDKLRKTS